MIDFEFSADVYPICGQTSAEGCYVVSQELLGSRVAFPNSHHAPLSSHSPYNIVSPKSHQQQQKYFWASSCKFKSQRRMYILEIYHYLFPTVPVHPVRQKKNCVTFGFHKYTGWSFLFSHLCQSKYLYIYFRKADAERCFCIIHISRYSDFILPYSFLDENVKLYQMNDEKKSIWVFFFIKNSQF